MNSLLQFIGRRLSMLAVMSVFLLGHAGSVWAQAYCFPANWWGFDLVNSANGQATINDQTCGCGSSAKYVDSGGGCNAAVTTRTTSAASNGDNWSVYVRSDYFSSCSNTTDITVTGSCRLTGKSQWYSVVATCSDHNTTATITMDSSILPLTPCTIEYMADSAYFNDVHVRDVIKFKNAITVTTPAPAYAAIGTSFNVAATALVGSVTISTSGNCTASSTGSGTASITMTGASSADCVVIYSSASDATYGADSISSNTNNNYYEGAYGGIKLNFKAFSVFDLLMTCGPTCAVTSANSTSWLQAGSGVVAGNTSDPGDTWFIRVATGTGADTTYTIASQINNMCLAKSGSNQVFAACNSADTAQQWKIAPFNGTDPTDAPTGVEFSLPASPGLWANANIGWGNNYMPIAVTADHDWTSAFFLGSAVSRADHIRFEFNGNTAYTCQPKSITIKACANAACSSLYTSNMTVTPATSSGTGSWAGLSAAPSTTFIGSTTVTLADTTDGANPTLSYSVPGSSYLSLPPTNSALECYNTATSSIVSCTGALSYSKTGCGFDAVEHNAAVGSNLYTKLANVAFPNSGIDVVATLTVAGVTSVNTSYTSAPTVELVDETTGTGCADRTALTPVSFSPAVPSAFVAGKLNVTPTYAKAARNVRVRIKDSTRGITGCSTDAFSIRPSSLALTVAAVDPGGVATAGTSANPNGTLGIKTGMTITATAKDGSANTLTTYTGTPSMNPLVTINDWSGTAISGLPNPSTSPPASPNTAQTLSWAAGTGFGAAVAGVATGTYYYNDFGTLTLPADTVVDSSYTSASGDQTADCVANSTSNTANAGSSWKYGCLVGSAGLTTPTFVPDHYEANLSITPTCAATVGPPATNAFSYMRNPNLSVTVDVKAVNAENNQMYRMWSDWGGAPALPTVAVTADNAGSAITLDATNSFALPNTTPWKTKASGLDGGFYSAKSNTQTTSAPFTAGFAANATSPLGPYEAFKLTMTLGSGKISKLNGSAQVAAASASSSAYSFRFGILKLDNAYGSELLPLSVPVKAMYWSGSATGWKVNTDDNGCTTVPAARVASGNFKGALTSGALGAISTTAISYGLGSIKIDKPTGAVTGSVDVAVNLGTVATVTDCLASHLSTAAPGSSLSWLRGNWCGGSYGADPTARVTFGAAKSPFLYRREKY